MIPQIYLFLKSALGRNVASFIVAISFPDLAVFSPNIVIVKWAVEWGAHNKYKVLAFRRAVLNRMEPQALFLREFDKNTGLRDYFLVKAGFNVEYASKKKVAENSLILKDFDMMLRYFRDFGIYVKCFCNRVDLIKIAAEKTRIDWADILDVEYWSYLNYAEILDIILPKAPGWALMSIKKEMYFRDENLTAVLLKYNRPQFVPKDYKHFKNTMGLSILAIREKLVPDPRNLLVHLMIYADFSIDTASGNILPEIPDFTKGHNTRVLENINKIGKKNFEFLIKNNIMWRSADKIFENIFDKIKYVKILAKYRFIDFRVELKDKMLYNSDLVLFYADYIEPEKYVDFIILNPELRRKFPLVRGPEKKGYFTGNPENVMEIWARTYPEIDN
jgi:hypothetical protein